MTKKVKEVIEMLENDGWVLKRTRGDHRMFWKKGARRPIPVPGDINDDLKIGTLKSILREMKAGR